MQVRFLFGLGSVAFVGGSLLSFPELLSDEYQAKTPTAASTRRPPLGPNATRAKSASGSACVSSYDPPSIAAPVAVAV